MAFLPTTIALSPTGEHLGVHAWSSITPSPPVEAQKLLDHWSQLVDGGGLPYRHDFDPIEIVALLPSVFLCRVVEGDAEPDVLFGIHGTRVAEIVGTDLTQKRLRDALPKERADAVARAIVLSVENRQPVRQRLFNRFPSREFMLVDRTIFPLADPDGRVSQALGILCPCDHFDETELTP